MGLSEKRNAKSIREISFFRTRGFLPNRHLKSVLKKREPLSLKKILKNESFF